MKKLFKNSHWSSEDKMLAAVGVVAAVGLFAIVRQRRINAAAVATPAAGIGAYFIDPVNLPISGLGSNYVAVR
jgi:hypothetical protein